MALGDMLYRETERNLYDIMVLDDPTVEALNVIPIQCGVLHDTSDQIYITDEGCKLNLYSKCVQRNFLKVSKLFGVSFLG